MVCINCQFDRVQTCLGDKLLGTSMRGFYIGLTEIGRHTLNVGGTTAWAGVLE